MVYVETRRMTAQDRDWVNSPKHILRKKIESAETDAIVGIMSGDKELYTKAMLRLSELYDEDK